MKIIAYLDASCRHNRNIRAIMNKYNLNDEERDISGISDLQSKTVQNLDDKPSMCVEIDETRLTDVSGNAIEDYLLKKGFIESVDRESGKALSTDEEQEAIRSKTERFF